MGGGDAGATAPRHRDHERAYRHFFGPVFAEGRTRRAGAHVEDSHRRDPLRWQRFCAGVLAVARYDGEGGKGLGALWDRQVNWQQTLAQNKIRVEQVLWQSFWETLMSRSPFSRGGRFSFMRKPLLTWEGRFTQEGFRSPSELTAPS